MEKLKFEFMLKAAGDGKSNFLALTSITTIEEKTFILPEEYLDIIHHTQLSSTTAFKKVKNSIKQRHQTRRVWITLDKALSAIYLDEENNVQFKDVYLEEQQPEKKYIAADGVTEETLKKMLHTVCTQKENIQSNDSKISMKVLSEKFVLEKFTNKSSNVTQWISFFESECDRLKIEKDGQKIEILRFFLEGACLDWYSSMLIKQTLDSEWTEWKQNFCETYADKGWTPVKYAFSFKYISGSLLEYALKKERMLLEMNKSIDTKTLIDLIATGLPDFVTDRINREDLKETKDLFNELRSLEHLIRRNKLEKKSINAGFKEKSQEKTPCKICEKMGKKYRYHSEQLCWFKVNEKIQPEKRSEIKYVHNSEIEAELNDVNPKN